MNVGYKIAEWHKLSLHCSCVNIYSHAFPMSPDRDRHNKNAVLRPEEQKSLSSVASSAILLNTQIQTPQAFPSFPAYSFTLELL